MSFPDSDCFLCSVCEAITDLAPVMLSSFSDVKRLDDPGFKKTLLDPEIDAEDARALIFGAFTSKPILNSSFRTKDGSGGIDIKSMDSFYRWMTKRPPFFLQSMMASIDHLIRRPGYPDETNKGHFRYLLIILLNPLLRRKKTRTELVFHHHIIRRCYGYLSNSLEKGHTKFIVERVLDSFNSDSLRWLVEQGNFFLNMRIAKLLEKVYDDWSVKAACTVMGLLFQSNFRHPRLPGCEFYNTAVDVHINIERDWARFLHSTDAKDRKFMCEKAGSCLDGLFCFCKFPFLVSMGTKMRLLSADAKRQQELRFFQSINLGLNSRGAYQSSDQPYLILIVRRDSLLKDSLAQISAGRHELKKKLKVKFVGEDGIDAGGLAKEWFFLLTKELFNPEYGIFIVEEESKLSWFNSSAIVDDEDYRFVGIILGLAIYNSIMLDVQFPAACFKKLLNVPLTLQDLHELQPSVARGLQSLLDYSDNDFDDVFCLSFAMTIDECGLLDTNVQEPKVIELIKDGSSTPVTQRNKHEYVSKYIDYVFNVAISCQFKYFKSGFDEVFSGPSLSLFRPEEMVQLVSGNQEIDINVLKSLSVYENFSPSEPVILWFWEIIGELSPEMKKKLLSFVTGTERIPAVESSQMSLKIFCQGEDCDRYPIGRTCFNQLCLYRYSSKEKLEKMLTGAILESEGFGIK